MAGLSQFSHHLRLICDTQLCQLKPLKAQLHSGLSELPALEHSCMPHYAIGQGTRKQTYEMIKKKKKKQKRGRRLKQRQLVSLIRVLWHINRSITTDQSLSTKGRDGKLISCKASMVSTHEIHSEGRLICRQNQGQLFNLGRACNLVTRKASRTLNYTRPQPQGKTREGTKQIWPTGSSSRRNIYM